jgi:hypothetical protein
MKKKTYTSIGLAMMLVLMAGSTLFAEEQGWINNSLSFKINKKFTLKFTNESRYNELTYTHNFMRNWQGGIVYNFSKKFYFAVLYKREDTKKTGFVLNNIQQGTKDKDTIHILNTGVELKF